MAGTWSAFPLQTAHSSWRRCEASGGVSGASAVLAIHNHPSGAPDPSLPDRQLTDAIIAAGGAYYSFTEHAALPQPIWHRSFPSLTSPAFPSTSPMLLGMFV